MFKQKKILFILIVTLLCILAACSGTDQAESSPEDADGKVTDSNTTDVVTAPDKSLQKKDEGEAVIQLQQALNQIGYELTESGIYDEATTWAITDFQLQQDSLLASGIYDKATKDALVSVMNSDTEITAGQGLPKVAEPVFTDAGTEIIANPYDQLALINKEHALPEDYIPEDMVVPNVPFPFTEDLPKKQMRQASAEALEKLFAAAEKEGMELYAQSGYRSYERQDAIFASNVMEHGEEEANTFSARPGESEHQSGLTMDITSKDVNFDLVTEFGDTPEGKWVEENAAAYGFIIRFPEGKEDITKYQYEPWHLRYVGVKAAKEIMSQGITLEEYLEPTN